MTDEIPVTSSTKRQGKFQYVLTVVAATILYSLSLLDPSIHGTESWVFLVWSSFIGWVSVLKLRNLIHGTGWVFPRTNIVLLTAISIETWLYLWLSR